MGRGRARLASQIPTVAGPMQRASRRLNRAQVSWSICCQVGFGVVMILRLRLQRVLLLTLAASGAALPQTAPVEPATSRLVRVNVIVRDRHGEPVRDLKKEDFRVYDNGKFQQISVFSMHSNALLPFRSHLKTQPGRMI